MPSFIKLLFSLGRQRTFPDNYYKKELEGLYFEHQAEELSLLMSRIILKASAILHQDNPPYPTTVFSTLDEISNTLSLIEKKKHSSYYPKALSLFETSLSAMEDAGIDKEELSNRHLLFNEFCETGTLDLDKIQEKCLDSYFLNFREYWEKAISQLKRTNAVVNRRNYLIELTNKFDFLLKQRKITKYSKLLSDYRLYNISELNSLQMLS